MTTSRVGFGFDVHPFSDDPTRPLVLGGVTLGGEPGLAGHSDADVVAHAVADALLGPAGLGDLGSLFPDTDPEWRGADSLRLLAAVVELTRRPAGRWRTSTARWSPKPPGSHPTEEMQRRLSAVVGRAGDCEAQAGRGAGSLGRREGIACHAVALIEREG